MVQLISRSKRFNSIILKRQEHLSSLPIFSWWNLSFSAFLFLSVVLFALLISFLCLVYPGLPVFLDCPFWITPSVFSSVYLLSNISLSLYKKVSHMTTYIRAVYAVTIYPIGLFYMNPIEPPCIENVPIFVKSVTR